MYEMLTICVTIRLRKLRGGGSPEPDVSLNRVNTLMIETKEKFINTQYNFASVNFFKVNKKQVLVTKINRYKYMYVYIKKHGLLLNQINIEE